MTDLPPAVAAHLEDIRRIIAGHEEEVLGLKAQIRHHQAEAQKYRLAEASVLHTVELMQAPTVTAVSGTGGYFTVDRVALVDETNQPVPVQQLSGLDSLGRNIAESQAEQERQWAKQLPEAPRKRRDLRQVVREILSESPGLYCETIAAKASEGGRLVRVTEIAHALERMGDEVSKTTEGLWSLTAADPEPPEAKALVAFRSAAGADGPEPTPPKPMNDG